MLKLDRYLFLEFAQGTFAVLVVLLLVSVGGAFTDVLQNVARGRVPAAMMLAQLGLVLLRWLPLILPLGLMLGLLLSVGRLYRDAEMPVLSSIGVGPKRMLWPLLWLVVPVMAVVALCSLWLGPWADRTSQRMIQEGNRSLLVAGLEPGRFTELPGGGGVAYVGSMSADGMRLNRVFIYRQKGERLDVTTARTGTLTFEGERDRYLNLEQGFEVEGPMRDGGDFRLMRYASNQVRMPDQAEKRRDDDPRMLPTTQLLGDARPQANAQLHSRLAPPLLTLAFALLALPLARSSPRQARYGRVLLGFLVYLVSINLMMLGTDWLGAGKLPQAAGLWWLTAPLIAIAAWLYLTDGRFGPLARTRTGSWS